jgi:hypothetical protein
MDRAFVGTKMVIFLLMDVLRKSECVLGYMTSRLDAVGLSELEIR